MQKERDLIFEIGCQSRHFRDKFLYKTGGVDQWRGVVCGGGLGVSGGPEAAGEKSRAVTREWSPCVHVCMGVRV